MDEIAEVIATISGEIIMAGAEALMDKNKKIKNDKEKKNGNGSD